VYRAGGGHSGGYLFGSAPKGGLGHENAGGGGNGDARDNSYQSQRTNGKDGIVIVRYV
jgi:hypothetical protein